MNLVNFYKIGKLKRFISDREGFTESPEFIRLLDEHNIKHIITSAPSGFAERMVKTFKDYVFDRVGGLKMGKEWPKIIENNSLIHKKIIHTRKHEE